MNLLCFGMPQSPSPEIYTNGYAPSVLDFMRRRTLASHGRFVEPLLGPGLNILDLGCGPGTMTKGLAEQVMPGGSVVGVDRNHAQFDGARALIGELPVTFCAMDAYRLEFPEGTFDGVFSHALFEHLARPLDALREVRRVLRKDGFVALRSPDWGGVVLHPDSAGMKRSLTARMDLQTRNGGNVLAGRHLGEWLRQAGFTTVRVTATYEIYPETHLIVEHLATQMEEDGQEEHAATWRTWGENPEALSAQPWFKAVGYKGIS